MTSRNKADKFVELANKRVNKAIKNLKLIENLSNKKNYEFTDEQAKQIIRALQRAVDSLKQNFKDTSSGVPDEFRL